MEIASSGLATYNNEFEQIIGLVTAGTEIMVGRSSQVARGLSTIAARIASNADVLEEYGIQVADTNGNLKSTYDVLSELKPKWDSMSDAERVALGETIAGVNQYKVLASVMANFNTAIEATATAYDSAGSAARENSRYLSGLEAQTNNLKATFQDLANNVVDDELVSSLLNLANGFLELANTPIGQFATQLLLLTSIGWGATSLLGATKIVPAAIKSFTTFFGIMKSGLTATTVGLTGAATAGSAFTVAMSAALPVIAAVAASIALISGAVKLYNQYVKEHSVEYLTEQFIDLNKEINQTNEKLEECKTKLGELEKTGFYDRTLEWREERAELEYLIMHYEYLLELQKQEQKEAARRLLDADVAGDVYVRHEDYSQMHEAHAQGDYVELTEEQSKALAKTYKSEAEAVYTLAAAFGVVTKEEAGSEAAIEDLKRQLDAFGVTIGTTTLTAEEYNKAQADSVANLVLHAEKIGDFNDWQMKQAEAFIETNAVRVEAIKLTGAQTEQEERLVHAYDTLIGAISETEKNLVLNSAEWNRLATAEDDAKQGLINYIAQEKIFNNSQLSVSDKIELLTKLAQAAIAAGMAIGGIGAISSSDVQRTISGYRAQGYTLEEARQKVMEQMLKSFGLKESTTTETAKADKTTTGTPAWVKQAEAAFDELEHEYNMGQITAEEYYTKLKEMNDQYWKGKTDYLDKYYANEEAYYKWQKSQAEDAIQAEFDLLEHQYNMGQISEEQYYNKLKQLNEQYYKDKEEYLDKYRSNEEAYYKWSIEQEEAKAKAVLENQQKILQSQKDGYDATIAYATEYISRQLDAINEQLDAIDAQYDAELETLEAQNDALDEQISKEQLLQNLAKAQSTMKYVYKDGRFQYVQDAGAVSEAQSNLAEFEREQALQKAKDEIEERRKLAKQDLESEKARWEELSDIWNSIVSDYEFSQNRLLANQQIVTDLENGNWNTRLENARNFAAQYTAIMQQIADVDRLAEATEAYYTARAAGDAAGMAVANAEANYIRTGKHYITANAAIEATAQLERGEISPENKAIIEQASRDYFEARSRGDVAGMAEANMRANEARGYGRVVSSYKALEAIDPNYKYAHGTLSAHGGLSMVGEDGPELRVLNHGDGILPADITRNLYRMGSNPQLYMNKNGTGNTNISVANITLPNVCNANEFVDGLRNLAYQRAYAR